MPGRIFPLAALAILLSAGSPAAAGGASREPTPPTGPSLASLPAIFGPGAVLRAGDVRMKITNAGILGNPYPNLSPDPSGMWPDSSGVEYLHHIGLAVGAVDPLATDPRYVRRVSFLREWGPPSADFSDRMYETAAGALNGARLGNDDGDYDPFLVRPRVDEDFLDGRDNDGDGMIDEDFAALGTQMFTCLLRDDSPYSEPPVGSGHVPLGLEASQSAWVYDLPGRSDFVAVEYTITNRSGHVLDSVYVGFQVDMDAGPLSANAYFVDDWDLPGYPSGEFTRVLASDDPRRQYPHDPNLLPPVPADSALCPRVAVRVNGFSLADRDGDAGQTPGLATFLLLGHTVDRIGLQAPARTGFRAFRSFAAGTPPSAGGNPDTDSLRYAFMSGHEGVDEMTGLLTLGTAAFEADYLAWCSVGPFLQLWDGQSVSVTVAFAVHEGTASQGALYPLEYAGYRAGQTTLGDLFAGQPALANAYAVQLFHDGLLAPAGDLPVTDHHGRETALRVPLGAPPQFAADCHDDAAGGPRLVTDRAETWFDFDCDYCTGVWDFPSQHGLFPLTWAGSGPVTAVEPAPAAAPLALVVWPSPAAGVARVAFTLEAEADIRLTVLDVGGRTVRELAEARLGAGPHAAPWDGRDEGGRPAPPGVYVVRLAAGARTVSAKLVRVR